MRIADIPPERIAPMHVEEVVYVASGVELPAGAAGPTARHFSATTVRATLPCFG